MNDIDTGFALMMRYKRPAIPLEQAAADWLPHLSHAMVKRRAGLQTLPWPVYRTDASQKGSYMVNIADIAAWLDQCHHQAAHEWQKMNG